MKKARESIERISRPAARVSNSVKCKSAAHRTDLFIIRNRTNEQATLIAKILPYSAAIDTPLGENKIQKVHEPIIVETESSELSSRMKSQNISTGIVNLWLSLSLIRLTGKE